MCGRFTIISDPMTYQMDTDIKSKWKVSYDVSTTQVVPIVIDANKNTVELMQWSILPAWT
jgi:putative SOS response-associated peptidase YedK